MGLFFLGTGLVTARVWSYERVPAADPSATERSGEARAYRRLTKPPRSRRSKPHDPPGSSVAAAALPGADPEVGS